VTHFPLLRDENYFDVTKNMCIFTEVRYVYKTYILQTNELIFPKAYIIGYNSYRKKNQEKITSIFGRYILKNYKDIKFYTCNVRCRLPEIAHVQIQL
jgi:hypothetical protein